MYNIVVTFLLVQYLKLQFLINKTFHHIASHRCKKCCIPNQYIFVKNYFSLVNLYSTSRDFRLENTKLLLIEKHWPGNLNIFGFQSTGSVHYFQKSRNLLAFKILKNKCCQNLVWETLPEKSSADDRSHVSLLE